MKKEKYIKPGEYTFFEYLKKSGLNRFESIVNKLNESSIENLLTIAVNCYALTVEYENNDQTDNFFDFSANETLSGSDYPCGYLPHRIINVKDLVIFSFLYSNSITILNPFEFVYSYIKGKELIINKRDEKHFKNQLLEALLIMMELEKSISLKKIYFTKLNYLSCKNCLKEIEKVEIKTGQELYKFAKKIFEQQMIEDINLTVNEQNEIVATGLDKYVGEEKIFMTFRKVPKHFKKYLKHKKIQLPKNEVKLYIDSLILNGAVNTIMMQYGTISRKNERTFLTNNQVEAEILNHLKNKNNIQGFSPNLLEGLNHLIPFVRGIKLDKVINFRRKYEKEFENYRNSINKVLNDTKGSKSQVEFEGALKDIVEPNLKTLDNIFIKKQWEILDKNIKGSLTCLIGISLGIATKNIELFSSSLVEGAYASINCLKEQYKLERSQRENNYYFLWKIKKLFRA